MNTANRYDELPYPGGCFVHSSPGHLALIGRLFKMNPANPERCRVLELGCAHGGNIMPLALTHPHTEFVGVDLSKVQINKGRARIASCQLSNIRLEHGSLSEVDASWGHFDYIICHGVYSWVDESTQQAILRVIKERLTPQGIGYVSYNTLPGWHQRLHIRDLMRYHAEQFEGTKTQITQARAIFRFLADATGQDKTPYGVVNRSICDSLAGHLDAYLFHEYLSPVNAPIYFSTFADRLKQHDLQYLGEAEFFSMLPSPFDEATQQTLSKIAPDILQTEQLLDYLTNRSFRKSLVVHTGFEPERSLTWERLRGLRVAASYTLKQLDDPNDCSLDDESGLTFVKDDVPLWINVPEVKAALLILSEIRPRALSLDALVTRARERLRGGRSASFQQDEQSIATNLLTCFARDFVELRTVPDRFVSAVSERPVASLVVRLMAGEDWQVTTLLHTGHYLDAFDQQLVQLCDGTRDVPALIEGMVQAIERGDLNVEWKGSSPQNHAQIADKLRPVVTTKLQAFARNALLSA